MRAYGWLVGAGALLAGLAVLAAGLQLSGYDAPAALGALWSGAFGSWDALTSATLVRAVPHAASLQASSSRALPQDPPLGHAVETGTITGDLDLAERVLSRETAARHHGRASSTEPSPTRQLMA